MRNKETLMEKSLIYFFRADSVGTPLNNIVGTVVMNSLYSEVYRRPHVNLRKVCKGH